MWMALNQHGLFTGKTLSNSIEKTFYFFSPRNKTYKQTFISSGFSNENKLLNHCIEK